MRKWILHHFNFTKSEFNGILTLFVLIMLVMAAPSLYSWFDTDDQDLLDVDTIAKLNLVERLKAPPKASTAFKRNVRLSAPKLHVFDPNTLDQQGWEAFGLSPRQAKAIINYKLKGGIFRKAEDLQKMYTIKPELYEQLKSYVHIKDTTNLSSRKRHTTTTYPGKSTEVYEINSLDTVQLQAINGIGPAFARRIFKYRERLGGFAAVDQLLEVFGIDSVRFAGIAPQIRVDAGLLKKININTADFETLRQHPYLRYKQVNAIIEYRKQHGNYSSFADLKKVAILPAETVDKLVPYFSF